MCQTLTVIPLAAMIFLELRRDHRAVAELRGVIIAMCVTGPQKNLVMASCHASRFRVERFAKRPAVRPGLAGTARAGLVRFPVTAQ